MRPDTPHTWQPRLLPLRVGDAMRFVRIGGLALTSGAGRQNHQPAAPRTRRGYERLGVILSCSCFLGMPSWSIGRSKVTKILKLLSPPPPALVRNFSCQPGQVGGHCQPQLISKRRQVIGRDAGQICGAHHAQTLRPSPGHYESLPTCQARHEQALLPW